MKNILFIGMLCMGVGSHFMASGDAVKESGKKHKPKTVVNLSLVSHVPSQKTTQSRNAKQANLNARADIDYTAFAASVTAAKSAAKKASRFAVKTAKSANSSEQSFLHLLDKPKHWTPVFDDQFNGKHINKKIWNVTADDSIGGFNNTLQAYNNNATDNIAVRCGNLEITAKAEWYVQPIGCKNVCRTPGEYNPNRAARPYTSGALNTFGKVPIDL